MRKGVDLSYYQGEVDFKKLKEEGIEFVILRCGYGKNESQKDKKFDEFYHNAKIHGLKVGAYLYSYAKNKAGAIDEVENCLKLIKGKTFELPIFYDIEDEKTTGQSSYSVITEMIDIFCSKLEENGYKSGFYVSENWYMYKLNGSELKQKYSLWLAKWGQRQSIYSSDFWQYTDKGVINGIKGLVDLNYCLNDKYFEEKKEEKNKMGDTVFIKCKFTGSEEGKNKMLEIENSQYWIDKKLYKNETVKAVICFVKENTIGISLYKFNGNKKEEFQIEIDKKEII